MNLKRSEKCKLNVMLHKWVKPIALRLFGNPCAFNAPNGIVIAWDECDVMSKHTLNQSKLNLKRNQEVQVKRVVAQVSQTDRFALHLIIRGHLKLQWDL
ncbi:uncharacterized protein G2W53_007612 [Senna tora]|uniref:Uncharacterized protein n=1 Tax=Senna tora TaxID=362788 RepID=A0A835CFY7_9FABA|nr:uncharacterized protein G2W53_007612 [Senna tora]